MIKKSLSTTVAVSAALLLSGCGGDSTPNVIANSTSSSSTSQTSSSSSSTSSSSTSSVTSSTSSSSSSSSSEAKTYAVGDCFQSTKLDKVDCSKPHKLEVSAVVPNNQYTDDLTKRAALRAYTCQAEQAKYTSGPAFGTILISDDVKPASDPKANEQIVCLVAKTYPDDSGYSFVQGTLKGIVAKEGIDKFTLCTTGKAGTDEIGKIVACNQPHVSEAFGGFQHTPFGPYPGEDKIDQPALKKCMEMGKNFLGATRKDIVIAKNSSGKGPWSRGSQLTACFVQTDGTMVTKSMKGIGNKPLSSLK